MKTGFMFDLRIHYAMIGTSPPGQSVTFIDQRTIPVKAGYAQLFAAS